MGTYGIDIIPLFVLPGVCGARSEVESTLVYPFGALAPRALDAKMDTPSLFLQVLVDGRPQGESSAQQAAQNRVHLTPWNAGFSKNNLTVGWVRIELPGLSAGKHTLLLRAQGTSAQFEQDAALIGADAQQMKKDLTRESLRVIQLDCWMITR